MDARIQIKMEKKEKVLFHMAAALNRRLQLMGSSEHSMLSFHLSQLDLKNMETFNASSFSFLNLHLMKPSIFQKEKKAVLDQRTLIGK